MDTVVSSFNRSKIAALSAVFWGVVIAFSLSWNLQVIEQHAVENALNRGRFVFEFIESTRLWNAKHGGVYVLRNQWTPTNPYLDIEEKDIQTPNGTPLTKMNPAYMTRQLAQIIYKNNQIRIHLTSLKPINPNNFADDWERNALKKFSPNVKEHFQLVDLKNQPIVRYMAPLMITPACLDCHQQQDYQMGDVRGGISISFPAQPFIQAIELQKRNMQGFHLFLWILLVSFSYFLLRKIQENSQNLLAEKQRQEQLVATRTEDLLKEIQMRRSAEEKIRLLVDTSAQAILGLDTLGKITFANPAAHQILQYPETTDLVGQTVQQLLQNRDAKGVKIPPNACRFNAAYSNGIAGYSEDETFTCANGKQIAVEYSTHPLFVGMQLVGAVINFSDISTRKERQKAMWHQANYDPLTDVPNRNLFMDRLQNAINQCKRATEQFALIYLDLDGFKQINDHYGHYAGDEVLRKVSHRIKQVLRESDTLARHGGDEFIVLLARVNGKADILKIADKIVKGVNRPIDYEDKKMRVGVSIGIAIFPEHGNNIQQLVKAADQAMYRAKALADKNIVFYSIAN